MGCCARAASGHVAAAPPTSVTNSALHSITSSARASRVGGTSRPSVFAVLRLTTSWYLVGACTGKTLGHQSRCAAGSPGILLSIEAKVACSVATTCAPSPTAAATRLIEPERTSPIAKIPRRLVSSGLRVSLQSPPVSKKPFASNATPDPDSHCVFGSASMNVRACAAVGNKRTSKARDPHVPIYAHTTQRSPHSRSDITELLRPLAGVHLGRENVAL